MGYIEKGQHPFEPRHDGLGCRQLVNVFDHRPVECGAAKGADIHTGTRPAPPALDFAYPPCSICGVDTSHDGDNLCCYSCGAYWGEQGPGSWNEPEVKVCTSTHRPFDRPNLAPEHEKIRRFLNHCILPLNDHEKHRSNESTTWTDEDLGRMRGDD